MFKYSTLTFEIVTFNLKHVFSNFLLTEVMTEKHVIKECA